MALGSLLYCCSCIFKARQFTQMDFLIPLYARVCNPDPFIYEYASSFSPQPSYRMTFKRKMKKLVFILCSQCDGEYGEASALVLGRLRRVRLVSSLLPPKTTFEKIFLRAATICTLKEEVRFDSFSSSSLLYTNTRFQFLCQLVGMPMPRQSLDATYTPM